MKRFSIICCIGAILFQLCFLPTVEAKLYTWVDKNGITRRTYYPPPPDQVMKKTNRKPAAKQVRRNNQVELFVTSWCPYCKEAIQFFRSKGVDIKIYDIEKDKNAALRKKKIDNDGGVPFAIVNGQYISGFAPSQYSRALK